MGRTARPWRRGSGAHPLPIRPSERAIPFRRAGGKRATHSAKGSGNGERLLRNIGSGERAFAIFSAEVESFAAR